MTRKETDLSFSLFVRDMSHVFKGNLFSQILTLLFVPILTRIYSPEAFGVYAQFSAVAVILGAGATLRFGQAIILVESQAEAQTARNFAFFTSVCLSALSVFSILFYSFCNAPANWVWFVPLIFIVYSVNEINIYGLNRKKDFSGIGRFRFEQACLLGFFQIFFSLISKSGEVLIMGQIIAQGLLGFLWWRKASPGGSTEWSRKAYLGFVHKFMEYPLYSLPADLISAAITQVPILIFGQFFGSAYAGQLSLSQRSLTAGSGGFTAAVGEVYRQRITDSYRARTGGRKLMLRTIGMTLILGILPTAVLIFYGPQIYQWVFGEQWMLAGKFSSVLAFSIVFGCSVSPITYVYFLAKRQREDFVLHASWIAGLFCSVIVSIDRGMEPLTVVFIMSVVNVLFYSIYLTRSFLFITQNENN